MGRRGRTRTAAVLTAAALSVSLSGCVLDAKYGFEESRVESALSKSIGDVDNVVSVHAFAQFNPTAKGITVNVDAEAADDDEVRAILREVLPAAVDATSGVKYASMVVTVSSVSDTSVHANASDLGLENNSIGAYREAYGSGPR